MPPLDTGGLLAALREALPRHRCYAERLGDATTMSDVRRRMLAAAVTANQRFEQAVAIMARIPDEPLTVSRARLLVQGARYPNQLAERLARLSQALWDQPERYRPRPNYHAWRQDILARPCGLGLAKATFGICLCDPLRADVCCVDRWVVRAVVGDLSLRECDRTLKRCFSSPTAYLDIEASVRALARYLDYPTFVVQWALWDSVRGKDEDHLRLVSPS